MGYQNILFAYIAIIYFLEHLGQSRIVQKLQIINFLNLFYNLHQMRKTEISSSALETSVVGVDMGSAFTKIAAVQKGKIDIITNQANLRQTPTVIGYGENQRLIGESGYGKMKSNLSNTIVAPNRYLGISEGSFAQQQSKHAPSSIKIINQELYWKVSCHGKQTKFCAEQVVAAFINKVQQIVELNKLDNKFIVFTVPDYYTQYEKQALLDAIQIAKLSLRSSYGVQIVNQSAAVGMDYGFYKQKQFTEKEEDGKNVLFIDFGHSKLSLYVIKFTSKYQKIVYKKQMRQMGCKSLDELMLAFYADIFHKNNPDTQITLWESRKALCKLLQNIQKQRKVLSGNSQADFNIDCLLEEKDIAYTMRRQQFQQICKPAIATIKQFVNQARSEILQKNIKLSSIELVGGGSRVPIFIRSIKQIFQIQPSRTLNSSECISRGAALCAAMNSNVFRVPSYPSVDASAHQIVCSWKGDNEQIQNQQNQARLFEPNEIIFDSKNLTINLITDKQKVTFSLLYRNLPLSFKSCFCQFSLNLPQKNSLERKIKLNFNFDDNQMIKYITAFEVKQKEEEKLSLTDLVFGERFTSQQILKFAEIEKQQRVKDSNILKQYQEKNIAESQIYSMKQKLEQSLRNPSNQEFIDPAIYNQYAEYFAEIANNFHEIDDLSKKMQQAHQKLGEYFSIIEAVKTRNKCIEDELKKLSDYVNAVMSGKIKNVRFYPSQDINNVINWMKSIQEIQKNKKKYQEYATNIDEVKKVFQELKLSVDQHQVNKSKKEKNPYHSQFQHHDPVQNQERKTFNNSFGYKPYNSPFQKHQPINRGSRFNSSNGYNPNPFSGFPGFY